MTLQQLLSERSSSPIGPYSQGIATDGFVYCSGQLPIDPSTGEMLSGTIHDQTLRAIANLEGILAAGGSGLDLVLRTTIFLVDIADFAAVNGAYEEAFGDHRPTRSTVAVSALPAGARLQIDCIAIRRNE